MAVDEGGRAINTEAARAPFPPHGRWQEAADAVAAGMPAVTDAWWVLLPTPAQVAATRGQPAALARLPAGHHAFAAYAEVRRPAGGYEEGAPAELHATEGGRGRGAAPASGAPPAPPAGECGEQGRGRPRSRDDGGGPHRQHRRHR